MTSYGKPVSDGSVAYVSCETHVEVGLAVIRASIKQLKEIECYFDFLQSETSKGIGLYCSSFATPHIHKIPGRALQCRGVLSGSDETPSVTFGAQCGALHEETETDFVDLA